MEKHINTKYFVVTGCALFLLFILFKLYSEDKEQKALLQLQLSETKKEIQLHKEKISKQEKIEEERYREKRKLNLKKKYEVLNAILSKSYSELNQAEVKLQSIKKFKLLRSSSERNEQVSAAQYDIDLKMDSIRKIDVEMKKVSNEINKI